VLVQDDGVGMADGADEHGHFGIRSMMERAGGLGGVCTLTSRPEGGVEVRAVLPTNPATTPSIDLPAPPQGGLEAARSDELRLMRQTAEDSTAAFARARAEMLATRDRLASAVELTASIFEPSLSEDDLLVRAAEWVAREIGGHAVIHTTAAGDGGLHEVACDVSDSHLSAHVDRLVSTLGHGRVALDTNEPFVFEGDADHPHTVIAPMKVAGHAIGTLSVARAGPSGGFAPDDAVFVAHLATLLAAALRLARDGS
jgi:hypothetical protein